MTYTDLQYEAIQKYLEECRKRGIEPCNLALLKECFKVEPKRYEGETNEQEN